MFGTFNDETPFYTVRFDIFEKYINEIYHFGLSSHQRIRLEFCSLRKINWWLNIFWNRNYFPFKSNLPKERLQTFKKRMSRFWRRFLLLCFSNCFHHNLKNSNWMNFWWLLETMYIRMNRFEMTQRLIRISDTLRSWQCPSVTRMNECQIEENEFLAEQWTRSHVTSRCGPSDGKKLYDFAN